MPYKLYKVSFSYETSGDGAYSRAKDTYFIAARAEAEARAKAEKHFATTPANHDLHALEHETTRCTVTEYRKGISLPELTLLTDKEKFELQPEVVKNGREYTLEYRMHNP